MTKLAILFASAAMLTSMASFADVHVKAVTSMDSDVSTRKQPTPQPQPPPPTKVNKGQSLIICELTNGVENVFDAVASLNVRLVKSADSLTTTVSGKVMQIDAPYSVSAPAMTSYDRAGTPDAACVTVTKQ